ncbi:hypothetical protein [Phosphitispora sp. TUW77]|uniref:hypothetical protein n=1 Tax=Phosphitispora sp. TUW77 TaxID=3152361 RepID=UPI003AB8C3C9
MPHVCIIVILTLLLSIPGWVCFSAFMHELSHLVISWVVGFKIKEYRLWSVPWGKKGFVDVLIPKGTRGYFLKRGLMHLAGPITHTFLIFVVVLGLIFSRSAALNIFWFTGFAVNSYFLVMNVVPENSDGRHFLDMLKGKSMQ